MIPKAVLITNKTNVRYFSGFQSDSAKLILLKGAGRCVKKGFLFTDSRYILAAKKIIPSSCSIVDTTDGFDDALNLFLKKRGIKRLGVEEKYLTVRLWKALKKTLKGIKLKDVGDEIDEVRMRKKSLELKFLKISQRINDKVFQKIKKELKPGQSELEIAWMIEKIGREFGADDISFIPIVAFGKHSACPHHQNTNKKLKRGDMVLIDMGFIYKGYCSDMTRVIFTKKPSAEQKNIYELVLKAQTEGIKKIYAGVSGKKADSFARSIIEKAGFGENYRHAGGHGVGLDIHEFPNLSAKYPKKIPEGCVVTVEPGVYLPGKFGIRIEDMILVKKKNTLNLTCTPKSLQSSIIQLK